MYSKIKAVPCSFNSNLTISIISNNSLVVADRLAIKVTLKYEFPVKAASKIINNLVGEDRILETQYSVKAAVAASKHLEWLDQRKKEIH